jgi:chitosanase
MISQTNKELILKIVNVFETGSAEGKYDSLVVYPDGKNDARQITFGRGQTTEESNLRELILMYINNSGIYSDDLARYLSRLGKEPLADDSVFKDLLIQSAREDPIMQQTQDEFFDIIYYNPAFQFFTENAFTLPLSLLIIYDSYIHSGQVLMKLRKLFGEYPPAKGGNEKKWTYSYVDVRHQWLKYNKNPIVQKTIYRTQCFKDQINSDNWNLDKLPIIANGVAVTI